MKTVTESLESRRVKNFTEARPAASVPDTCTMEAGEQALRQGGSSKFSVRLICGLRKDQDGSDRCWQMRAEMIDPKEVCGYRVTRIGARQPAKQLLSRIDSCYRK